MKSNESSGTVPTRKYRNGKENISLLGFGCMRLPLKKGGGFSDIDTAHVQKMVDYAIEHGVNYFDTAWPYHDGHSEGVIGNALKKHPRESFHLATKLPLWAVESKKQAVEIFEEQLKNCKVDYFDFYLFHCFNVSNYKIFKKFELYDVFKKLKEQGKIKHLGFSFHDHPDLLETIASGYEWDFAMIQLNYLDWEVLDAKRQYEILTEKNIPVVVMEPVRGGVLASLNTTAVSILKKADPDASTTSWALRYAASLPNTLLVLSGMSELDHVIDNVNTMANFKPLSKDDYKTLDEAIKAFKTSGTIACTDCKYCMEYCPEKIDIPRIFSIYNLHLINKLDVAFMNQYKTIHPDKNADSCTACESCMEHCPQHLKIPKHLKEINKTVEKINS